MPPTAAKDFAIILFDLKAASRTEALHALLDVVLFKQLSQSKDLYKIFLVNASTASNSLSYKGIRHIDAFTCIATLAEEISNCETGTSDWCEALDLAIEELKAGIGAITLQILFITDLISFERPNNGKLYDNIIKGINDLDIFLYVIGPSIDPPKTIYSHKDVQEWMASLEVDTTNSNLKIMRKIVIKTPNSVMCNYIVGVELFHSFKYFKGMQPWLVPLSFGSLLNLPASTIRLSKREPPFKLKSTTKANYAEDKWAYEDQQDVLIDHHDTVPGVIKHGKFVKIESDGRFKIEGARSLRVLCFTKAENVPEYLLQSDGSYFVIPDPKCPNYFECFNTLVEQLEQANLYVIARRVYNKDFNPKFVALIPKTNLNTKGFILCQLPYADDIAHTYTEQPLSTAQKVDANKDVYNFLDSINVDNENCQLKVPLAPPISEYASGWDIIEKVKEKTVEEQYLVKKKKIANAALNMDTLQNKWPVRQLETVKKEETKADDFDNVDDFSFN
ncbi:unnamed protein product [Ceutorhynchus assimilis]|uniref:Ku domain-containing protein n=1 Tax=Ceutorhynchus assimilis TaxID=467358 RepID=A0A9N9MGK9_9CUCU|nr:unnamed protein product [Ceutorhynchus assimilis]